MSWMDKQVSLCRTQTDNIGKPSTFRQVLFVEFFSNIKEICSLRSLIDTEPDYQVNKAKIKSRLQGYTPAALLHTREKGQVSIIERTGMMQLDFDYQDISDYDIEELKQAIFDSLSCVGFCGLSCSGKGFYVLIQIAEPDRLAEYAEHCFEVFEKEYGIKVDTSKGRNPQDLRFVSYDSNMLYRENPEPLKISHFRRKEAPKRDFGYKLTARRIKSNDALVSKLIGEIKDAQVGQRWGTVQKIAYTLGGLNQEDLLDEINRAIVENSAFAGQEEKYLKCAADCFRDGSIKPLI